MSEQGVFAVDRGIWGHPLFADEAFTEREAWSWMISEAAWKAKRVRVGAVRMDLARGQLSHSLRFMAAKWKWSEPRVRRFLKRLKTDAMIDASSDAGVTLITVCNYDKYQRVSLPADAATDAPCDAAPTQHRRKEEDIKYIEQNAAPKSAPSEEADLFERGKKVLGRDSGGLIAKLLKSKKEIPLARAAIEVAATKQNPREYIGRILSGPARAGPVLMENGQPHPEGIV